MCTNIALVERLEWYMDEVIGSFEDFVKQSLVIITIAIGGVIAVLIYALKIINDRQPEQIPSRCLTPLSPVKKSSEPKKSSKNFKRNMIIQTSRSNPKIDKSVNTEPLSTKPSYDETIMSSVTTSSKNYPSSTSSLDRKDSTARLVTSLPTNYTNRPVSPLTPCPKIVTTKKSCCSLCCTDDERR